VDITPFDPATASEDDLRGWWEVDSAVEREQTPTFGATPYEESVGWLLHQPGNRVNLSWVAREGGRIVGAALLKWWTNNTSKTVGEVHLVVAPDARRRGVGRALARTVAAEAMALGRTSLTWETPVGAPGEPFLTWLGATRRQLERRSELVVADVDRSVLEQACADAAERAADYELVTWVGDTPEEYLAELARVAGAINDAPQEGLEIGDDLFTPEDIREIERGMAPRRQRWLTAVARHRPTGQLGGYTNLLVPDRWPERAYQENTAVDPAHRSRGLGRWIKAANLLQLMDLRPSTEIVSTWNAASNDHMLDINVWLGFRPAEEWGMWQGDTAAVLAATAP
jgi:GNAT superfamily N-acetyltransferase